MSAALVARYHPSRERLRDRRRFRIVNAAIKLEAAHEAVLAARYEYGRGTPECTAAVNRRADVRLSLFYHVREHHREELEWAAAADAARRATS